MRVRVRTRALERARAKERGECPLHLGSGGEVRQHPNPNPSPNLGSGGEVRLHPNPTPSPNLGSGGEPCNERAVLLLLVLHSEARAAPLAAQLKRRPHARPRVPQATVVDERRIGAELAGVTARLVRVGVGLGQLSW